MNDFKRYLKAMVVLIVIILLLVGALIGYILAGGSCNDNPFIYGIRETNKLNDEKFTCSCSNGMGDKFFEFDEHGINNSINFENRVVNLDLE